MTSNRFGGAWTELKLQVLGEYLDFYSTALHAQPTPARPFHLLYIDAFAGTGRCRVRVHRAGAVRDVPGSASIALGAQRPFDGYHFIEPKARKLHELRAMVERHPHHGRCTVHAGLAEATLPPLLDSIDWRGTRAVLFLDPFGLECDWPLLQRIQATKAVDVFFLLSVSGLFRQAALSADGIDEGKAARLTRVLGTSEWRTAWYAPPAQADLFDGQGPDRRAADWTDIVAFATHRLRMLFPLVLEPKILRNQTNAPLFALYLAVSNPHRAATDLARRVGDQILSKLR